MCDPKVEKLIKQLMKVRLELEPLLEKKASLEELLKENVGVYESGNVKVTVSDVARKTVDWNTVKEKFKLTPSKLARFTKESLVRTLKLQVRG
jgi:hypothetical protein